MHPENVVLLIPGVLAATREDPAQDQLRMVIIGLVALAGVLVVVQLVFWRVTSPRRRVKRMAAENASASAARAAAPITRSADRPIERVVTLPMAPVPIAPTETRELGSYDAPWPPPRIAHRGTARAARPADPPGSVLGRLCGIPDLDDDLNRSRTAR